MRSMTDDAWYLLLCATDYTLMAHMHGCWGCTTSCTQDQSHEMVPVLQDMCDYQEVVMAIQNNSAMLLQQPECGQQPSCVYRS